MLKHQYITEYYYMGLASYTMESAFLCLVTALVALVPDAIKAFSNAFFMSLSCARFVCLFWRTCQWRSNSWKILSPIAGSGFVVISLVKRFISGMLLFMPLMLLANAWGYIDGKMFQAVSKLPWALAVGDLQANLAAVGSCTECPSEVVT
eukprot:5681428-Amphidinium_carterae.1